MAYKRVYHANFGSIKLENGTLKEKEILVLNTVLENGFYTYDDIAKATSISKRTVIRILVSLEERGYIVREESKKKGRRIVVK